VRLSPDDRSFLAQTAMHTQSEENNTFLFAESND
jgi:hypothetical protein